MHSARYIQEGTDNIGYSGGERIYLKLNSKRVAKFIIAIIWCRNRTAKVPFLVSQLKS